MTTSNILDPQDAARAQLARLKDHWQAFWFELKSFYESDGWRALGYTSFPACVEAELGFSKQRAYQILDAAMVRESLTSQPGLTVDALTERHARELKPLTPDERVEVWRKVADASGVTAQKLRVAVEQYETTRASAPPVRQLIDRSPEVTYDPIATIEHEVAASPAYLAGKALERLRLFRETVEQARGVDAIVADVMGPRPEVTLDWWLRELQKTEAIVAEWIARLESRLAQSA